MRYIRRIPPFQAVLFTFVLAAIASPLLAQGSYPAGSCNQSDVNAVINGPSHKAVNGDTIIIPAGTCTWTSALAVTAGITVTGSGTPNAGPSMFGAGTPTTIIIDNYGSGPIIMATNITSGQTFRLSLLDIEPESSSTALWSPISIAGTCTSTGCPNLRIDNIVFGKTTPWTEGGNGSNADTMIRTDNVFGVLDHNTLPTGSGVVFYNLNHSAYLGVGGYGDNSWAQPDSFGGANNLFAENNSVYIGGVSLSDAEFAPAGGGIGGGRQVGRFNQIVSNNGFGVFGLHGLDTDGRPRSGRQLEVYGNSITCTNGSCNIIAGYRGGTGFTFGNTFTNTGTGFFNYIAAIAIYRTVYSAPFWAACGGSSPYDTNDGAVYYSGRITASNGSLTMTDASKSWTTNQFIPAGAPYSIYDSTQGFWSEINSNTSNTLTINGPISESGWTGFNNGDSYQILRATVCADQGGRGQGNYLTGGTPSPASSLSQVLDPIYEWNDSMNPVRLNSNIGTDTRRTIANRDWYTDGSNGTPRAQTSPTSPFNGTAGVGWGTMANRPNACMPNVGYWATDQGHWNQSGNNFGQGELFVCTTTNTWALHYMPYSYPHPLTQGTAPTAPPSKLAVTVQ